MSRRRGAPALSPAAIVTRDEAVIRLSGWIASGVVRVQRNRRLGDSVWLAAGLGAILACFEAVRQFVHVAPVTTAVGALAVLAAFGLVAAWLIRFPARPDGAAVAAAADRRMGGGDLFLSAWWFASRPALAPLEARHVADAARRAEELPGRAVFAWRVPPEALVVAFCAASLLAAARVPPPATVATTLPAGEATADSSLATRMAGRQSRPDGRTDPAPSGVADPQSRVAALWHDLETWARGLPERPDAAALREAVASRDAEGVARALRVLPAPADGDTPTQATVNPEGRPDQMNDAMAKSILDRVSALLSREDGGAAPAPAPAARRDAPSAAELDRELRADDAPEAGKAKEESRMEDVLNTALRALSRESLGGRDNVHGEAASTDGGRTRVGGSGAMGRRVNVSQAGGGEGDRPGEGKPLDTGEESILGARTRRLQVKPQALEARRATAPETREDDDAGGEEAFYAATQAQASRLAFDPGTAHAQGTAESVLERERAPIGFRDAVKRFTLGRHRHDEPEAPR